MGLQTKEISTMKMADVINIFANTGSKLFDYYIQAKASERETEAWTKLATQHTK